MSELCSLSLADTELFCEVSEDAVSLSEQLSVLRAIDSIYVSTEYKHYIIFCHNSA